MRQSPKTQKHLLKQELADLEMIIDKGDASFDTLHKRAKVLKSIQEVDKLCAMEASQKAKIKWAIEGDENSKYYHGDSETPSKNDIVNEVQSTFVADSCGCGMFNGIVLNSVMHLSHMFYVDDAVFMGQWSTKNIDTIIYVLKCFHHASCLSINLSKSKLLGVVVSEDRVVQAANRIGCGVLKAPFAYLGSKVGGNMSRIKSWDEIMDKMVDRCTLFVGEVVAMVRHVCDDNKDNPGAYYYAGWKCERRRRFRDVWSDSTDLSNKMNLTWLLFVGCARTAEDGRQETRDDL
ncbi:hypothetical protein Tco_0858424 [Tanacetum coccineum]|uniref:RNA-directed DNA polymerase, eukaryota, reverse transcriptase zinc-binding domain protein n=1 Tax=Tanacetum coccineum TaxID=301880 RepID=A0ABQ5BCE1_9ASTR